MVISPVFADGAEVFALLLLLLLLLALLLPLLLPLLLLPLLLLPLLLLPLLLSPLLLLPLLSYRLIIGFDKILVSCLKILKAMHPAYLVWHQNFLTVLLLM